MPISHQMTVHTFQGFQKNQCSSPRASRLNDKDNRRNIYLHYPYQEKDASTAELGLVFIEKPQELFCITLRWDPRWRRRLIGTLSDKRLKYLCYILELPCSGSLASSQTYSEFHWSVSWVCTPKKTWIVGVIHRHCAHKIVLLISEINVIINSGPP